MRKTKPKIEMRAHLVGDRDGGKRMGCSIEVGKSPHVVIEHGAPLFRKSKSFRSTIRWSSVGEVSIVEARSFVKQLEIAIGFGELLDSRRTTPEMLVESVNAAEKRQKK